MNLLEETKDEIHVRGYTPEDIIFIGSEKSGHQCTWEQFTKLADMEYDNGYGGQNIASDLIIVFSDQSMLHREEYDGSEWWGYHRPFKQPPVAYHIKSLVIDSWDGTLSDINKDQP